MQNTTTVLIIALVVVVVLILLGGVGMIGFGGFGMGPGMMNGNGMMGGYGYGYGFNLLGMIISLVSWALIIGGIVLLVIWFVRNAGKATGASGQTPLDILKARYAKGEITKDQFEEMKRELA